MVTREEVSGVLLVEGGGVMVGAAAISALIAAVAQILAIGYVQQSLLHKHLP